MSSPATEPLQRPVDHFLVRHGGSVSFIFVTVVMLLVAGMFYMQGHMVAQTKTWVVHTYEVMRHIQITSNKAKDAELGQRGYMLTGDDRYLQPYNDAVREDTDENMLGDPRMKHNSLLQEIRFLRDLTNDNPAQQKRLDEMEAIAKDLLHYWDMTIAARRENRTGQVEAYNPLSGKKMMDALRKNIADLIREENRLLALRTEEDKKNSRLNNILIFGGTGFFYLAMMGAVLVAARHRRRARQMEAEVYERAQELAQINVKLQSTNDQLSEYTQELQRNEEELKAQQEELEVSNEEMEEKTRVLEEQNEQIRRQSNELSDHRRALEGKARELELSSKYKSEFLANMSHELRTPLNSLLILARSLAANEQGNLTAEQIEEARVIHGGGMELLGLINDILDLSKVEAGKLNFIADNVSPLDILKRLEQQFEPISKQEGIGFHLKMADDLPDFIYTDQQRVEQILKNLLSNAFKFTEQGAVTLSVRRAGEKSKIQRLSLEPGNAVAFSVMDTGIGIDEHKLKDIFEAFQQEDGSTDRHYGGTGLGLTIARKFAHMLGGEIQVASRKGEGSTFTLILPLHMPQQESDADAHDISNVSSHQDNARPRHVLKDIRRSAVAEFIADDRKSIGTNDKVLLIIEDDPDFAAALVKIARKKNYKCLAAGDGKTGMLLAAEQPVSAIILDLRLPDIDGINVLEHLKHDLRTRHIPVHIITGRSEESNIVPLRKGAAGYLTKPVSAEDLDRAFARLESVLQAGIKKILVVEDDKKSQTAIRSLLQKKDVEITMAGTGKMAMERCSREHFDCIILDLSLPDMTGFQWLKQAEKQAGKGAGKEQLPPVVIYTAKDLSEEENRALNQYTGSIVIKGANSSERLLDEVTLFLHSVESTLSSDQQAMIRMQHDPDRALQGRAILLVDDDMRNTFALSKVLKKHGMHVIIADNGQMALEKLKEDKTIELVIMDIMMPVMDGYQAMQEIRRRKEYQNMPIIALTARAMPEEQEKCMAAGANDYMTKPVDIERLLTLMRVWLFRQEKIA